MLNSLSIESNKSNKIVPAMDESWCETMMCILCILFRFNIDMVREKYSQDCHMRPFKGP